MSYKSAIKLARKDILRDPATHYWVRQMIDLIDTLQSKDPIDALNNIETVKAYLGWVQLDLESQIPSA